MGFLDAQQNVSEEDKDLSFESFKNELISIFNDDDILTLKYKAEDLGIPYVNKKAEIYEYNSNEKIIICPEPLDFIREFDDVSDDASMADSMFREKISTFQKLTLKNSPTLDNDRTDQLIWRNKTLTGINLRPGNFKGKGETLAPVKMCDDDVHGIIVGRTGSGKSVFINSLILSLITEYAPWELNLYLVDLKKVELSRYMNDSDENNQFTPFTPHINACAATSEIRYTISLIRYLVDCMNARQEMFARLGVTKIQEFRNKYNVVLPRVLLIVDEFQQLFMEATNREQEEIQSMLNAITKLGRATGFHLIFASQEMSGTLRGNTLANFKIRMTLPCNAQVSSEILGNKEASTLERGNVLINTEGGDAAYNKKYHVPFIEADKKDEDNDSNKTPFYEYLDKIKLASKKFDIDYKTSRQKFYREELQETEHSYIHDIERIRDKKNTLVNMDKSLFDGVILGKTVVYSPAKNDKVSFYIERGLNKGVMIASPNPDDVARMRKLLAENLLRTNNTTYHVGVELNNLVLERYNIEKDINKYDKQYYFRSQTDNALEDIQLIYNLRQTAKKHINKVDGQRNPINTLFNDIDSLLANDEEVSKYYEYKAMNNKFIGTDSRNAQIVDKFLRECSNIELAPDLKASLTEINYYNEVLANYNKEFVADTKKNIELVNRKIDIVTRVLAKENKKQYSIALLQSKVLKRALQFLGAKYDSTTDDNGVLTEQLEKAYEVIKDDMLYIDTCEKSSGNEINKIINALNNDLQEFIDTLIKEATNNVMPRITSQISPKVKCDIVNNELVINIEKGSSSDLIAEILNDILSSYISVCKGKAVDGEIFNKAVCWINGLDEVDRIPTKFADVVRNSLNVNMLIVAMITSELKDSSLSKNFDYAFITGNVEKFYNMWNIKYTKQPLNSMVVNFGIRSKGLDIPFKMYKSNLSEIRTPDFINQLLNE